ncbi:hypothetical protein M0638_03960 [Roseomonas sp. NAR14]|uniref:Uncharacterized protein n=1 Tax=Roseomonas acroporae TaxID=2937791 RepID=A0A9X1Y5P8_9PROT|nr:hypothetical protein [Roseomonas acroporae]MCK8783535.1 hypothetical protein [Roseomonas acroporae]
MSSGTRRPAFLPALLALAGLAACAQAPGAGPAEATAPEPAAPVAAAPSGSFDGAWHGTFTLLGAQCRGRQSGDFRIRIAGGRFAMPFGPTRANGTVAADGTVAGTLENNAGVMTGRIANGRLDARIQAHGFTGNRGGGMCTWSYEGTRA